MQMEATVSKAIYRSWAQPTTIAMVFKHLASAMLDRAALDSERGGGEAEARLVIEALFAGLAT